MPRPQRREVGRRGYAQEHLDFLYFGYETFSPHTATGWDCRDLTPDDRTKWFTTERLEEIRGCWQALLDGRLADPDGIATKPECWARLVFVEGLSPDEASNESFWRSESGQRIRAAGEQLERLGAEEAP